MASPPKHVTDAAQSSKVVFIKLFVIVDPPAGSHRHAAASVLALSIQGRFRLLNCLAFGVLLAKLREKVN